MKKSFSALAITVLSLLAIAPTPAMAINSGKILSGSKAVTPTVTQAVASNNLFSSPIFWIITVAVVAIIVGVVFYFILRKDSDENSTSN